MHFLIEVVTASSEKLQYRAIVLTDYDKVVAVFKSRDAE